MSFKDSGGSTIGYLVYLNKDFDLVLIHALIRVAFHHIVQRIFNCTSLYLGWVCNWDKVNGHLRLEP
jgi:hypothetical protein